MVVFGCFDYVVVVLLFWVLYMLFLGCYALVCIAYAAILVCFVTLVGVVLFAAAWFVRCLLVGLGLLVTYVFVICVGLLVGWF